MDYLVYNTSELPPESMDLRLLDEADAAAAAARGERFALVRSVLRRELARRTGIDAPLIHFTYNQHGKPDCEHQNFNLSHSGNCLCMAFHHAPVGVDVERIRQRDFARLAPRFMCPEQLEGFLSRHCPMDEFYICWCVAEALVKHAGSTMWYARNFPFIFENETIQCLFDSAPHIQIFTPMPGYQGAVAFSPA